MYILMRCKCCAPSSDLPGLKTGLPHLPTTSLAPTSVANTPQHCCKYTTITVIFHHFHDVYLYLVLVNIFSNKFFCCLIDPIVQWIIHINTNVRKTYITNSNPMVTIYMNNLNKFRRRDIPWKVFVATKCLVAHLHLDNLFSKYC